MPTLLVFGRSGSIIDNEAGFASLTLCFRVNFYFNRNIDLKIMLFPHAQCRPTGVYLLQTRTGVPEMLSFMFKNQTVEK